MIFRERRGKLKLRATSAAIALAAVSGPVSAQTANVTVANVNAFNLIAPFLTLNASAIGQETLQLNLSQAVAINNNGSSVALLNGFKSTAELAALAISDENLLGSASNTVYGLSASQTFGVAANLAGGLPTQASTTFGALYNGQQSIGGFGSILGAAYVNDVQNGTKGPLSNTVTLLTTALSFIGNTTTTGDSQVAKFYFANGTYNETTPAVAPSGSTLPTANGLPNTSNSVYDLAYGVSNTQSGQNKYGDSHPYQTASLILYDPTVKTAAASGVNPGKPSSNPSFPSSHMAYAMTDSVLLGMLVPQFYQSMLLRASEMGESRIVVGVHYPIDIIASRAFATYDLAQYLSNPAYINNASVTGTAVNLPSLFQAAQGEIQTQLAKDAAAANCGTSLATCATSSANVNPYAPSATNAAIYAARLTYGLPTLSFTQGPREAAPTGGPDASILLATVYGGSTTAAKAIAGSTDSKSGYGVGMLGSLSTNTINQIIVNTETNAIAAFYGTSLSYWARINLYDAASYFDNVSTGTLITAAGDKIFQSVTVASGGAFGGSGTVNGNLTLQSGGVLAAQGNGTASYTGLTVTGTSALQAGSSIQLTGVFLPGSKYTLLTTGGALSVDPGVAIDTASSGNLMTLFSGQWTASNSQVQIALQSHFASAAETQNQRSVASAIDAASNAGTVSASGAAFLNGLIANNTAATAPAAYNALSGEGLTGQQTAALNAGNLFVTTVLGQATFWADDRSNDIFGLKDGGSTKDAPSCSMKDGYPCAIVSRARLWAAGFGQYASLEGQGSKGSASQSGNSSGVATGIDYQVTQNILLGLTGGYSDSTFSVKDRATSGTVEGGYIGAYGAGHYGQFYVAGTIDYANYDNRASRSIEGLGALQSERGTFSSEEVIAKFEGGYKGEYAGANVTPFVGFQIASLYNDGFSETGIGGSIAGLSVNSETIDSDRSILGIQFDTKTAVYGWTLTPYARISWEHEFNPDRKLTASFEALPGASFTVYGAGAASDLAHVNTGFKLNVTENIAAFAAFDGEFSDRGDSYAGTGGLRIRW